MDSDEWKKLLEDLAFPPPPSPTPILNDEAKAEEKQYSDDFDYQKIKSRQDAEMRALEIKNAEIRNDIDRECLESNKQDRTDRHDFANRIFMLICIFLLAIFSILFNQGIDYGNGKFNLQTSVILSLTGGMTVTVVGLFAIVARYFFPDKNNNDRSQKERKNKSRKG